MVDKAKVAVGLGRQLQKCAFDFNSVKAPCVALFVIGANIMLTLAISSEGAK